MSKAVERMNRRLARLAVRVGANVSPGQDVFVLPVDLEHAPLVRAIAAEAYLAGARLVNVLWLDNEVKRSRLAHAPAATLGEVPGWLRHALEECRLRRGAIVAVLGDPRPRLFDDLEADRVALDHTPITPEYLALLGTREVAWTEVFGPTPGLAARILGTPDVAALWELLAPFLRLDGEDPGLVWRRRMAELGRRAARLQTRGLVELHFRGPGTDLSVGLLPGTAWTTAEVETAWGRRTVVNLPSEEVFATPHRERASGTVTLTRPLPLANGTLVEGARLRFAEGRVVEAGAVRGAEALRGLVATDPGAARLGEVALVDGHGPIAASGRVFGDVILDENAACHLALGQAYAFTVPALPDGREARRQLGFNESEIHQDLMVGGPEVVVEGVDAAGRRVPILDGRDWEQEV